MRQRKTTANEPASSLPDYDRLAETIPQIVWTARPDGQVDYYNQRWTEYTGLSIEESEGAGWAPIIHPDDLENCLQKWAHALASGEVYEVEYRFRRASDGAYRWHLGRAIPVRDGEGQIVKWFGTCTDIHDQKQTQEELRRVRAELTAELQQSDNRYRLIVETANEGIWALDANLLICYINGKMQEILGYCPQEMYGKPVTDFVFEEDIPLIQEMMRERKAGLAGKYERRFRHRDGSERWLSASASPVIEDGVFKGATALLTDVTETRRAAALMGALNEMYKDMVDNATDLIYTTDAAGTFTYFNPTAVGDDEDAPRTSFIV